MSWPELREPFSALSHALGVALALPGTAWLWSRAAGDRSRRVVGLIFGAGLVACYSASTLYHSVPGDTAQVAWFRRLDHVGIDWLIAGTYTPIAWILLRGRWRAATLSSIWLAAAADAWSHLVRGPLDPVAATAIYLAMGWGSLACYIKLSREHPQRRLWPILGGGLAYSLGAICHVVDRPTPWPGVIGPHDVFHVFVLLGSLLHFGFILGLIGGLGWQDRSDRTRGVGARRRRLNARQPIPSDSSRPRSGRAETSIRG